MTNGTELLCPGCAEQAQDAPPTNWIVPAPVPAWSHRDGSPLCPTMGAAGYHPVEPIEIVGRELSPDEALILDGVSFNFGPFCPADLFDVVELIDSINDATDGDLEWATTSVIHGYLRRSHVPACDYAQSAGAAACDCIRRGGTVSA